MSLGSLRVGARMGPSTFPGCLRCGIPAAPRPQQMGTVLPLLCLDEEEDTEPLNPK